MNSYRASSLHPILIGILGAALAAIAASIQSDFPVIATSVKDSSWLDLFIKGGWSLWLILTFAIFGLLHIFSQALSQRKNKHAPAGFEKDVVHLVDMRGVDAGLALCLEKNSSLSHILYAALLRYGSPRQELESTIREECSLLLYDLQRNSRALLTILVLIPLLGFLGSTVSLIHCFDAFTDIEQNKFEILLNGTAFALLPLAFALVVFIPLLLGYLLNKNASADIARDITERAIGAIVTLDRKARSSIRLIDDIEENLETQQMTAARMPLSESVSESDRGPDLDFDLSDSDSAIKSSVATPEHLSALAKKDESKTKF